MNIANNTFTYPKILGDACVDVTLNPLSVKALSETQMDPSDKLEDIILYVSNLHIIAIPNMVTNHT